MNFDLSIIIPIYNVEKYVLECIQSVVNQLKDNMEVILIDDGSTDDSSKLIQPYVNSDKYIYYYRQDNKGLSAARNKGIELARGEYLFFLDSDDYIAQDTFDIMLAEAKKNKVDLVFANHVLFNEGEKTIDYTSHYNIFIYEKDYLLNELLKTGTESDFKYVICCNKMMKKTLLENCMFAYGKYHEDEYIIHHLYDKISRAIYIDKVTYFIRVRQGSIINMGYNEKKFMDAIGFGFERMQFMKESYPCLYSKSIVACAENITINYLLLSKSEKTKNLKRVVKKKMLCLCPYVIRYTQIKKIVRYFCFIVSPGLYKQLFWE